MPVDLAADLDDLNLRFAAAIAALEAALKPATPDTNDLGKRRVALARVASERVRFVHGRLCPMLATGETPRHADAARQLRERIAGLIAESNRHIGEWSMARIVADWAGYGAATRVMATQARAVLTMERREIYPLLATLARAA